MTTLAAEVRAPTVVGRIVAIDLARFLAIVGMMGAHLVPGDQQGIASVVVSGFPSTLFAVLGGVTAILSTRRFADEGAHLAAAVALGVRGLIVAGIGLLLALTHTPVIVVLVYLGVSMICATAFLRMPVPGLLVSAAVLGVGGPYLNLAVRGALGFPESYAISYESPGSFLASIFFTGTYPVVTWLVYVLVGMAVGRMLVRSRLGTSTSASASDGTAARPLGPRLALIGGTAFVVATVADLVSRPYIHAELDRERGVSSRYADLILTADSDGAPIGYGWRVFANAAPHSGSVGDILRTGGAAVLVIGLLLIATHAMSRVPIALRPVVAAGAAPLTIYSVHVLATAAASDAAIAAAQADPESFGTQWWAGGWAILGVHVLGALVFGAILAALHRRGPLEAATSLLSNGAGLAVRRASARERARRRDRPSDD